MKKATIYLVSLSIFFVQCTLLEDEDPVIDIPVVVIPDTPTPAPADPPAVVEVVADLVPCDNGFSGSYPCSNYDLLNRVSLTAFQSDFANDNWGWTDPDSGKEYVLQGLDDGTAFVDVSSPGAVRYIGKLPSATEASTWRDIKVYNNHAFIVSEAAGHGLQVFDLRRLRNQTSFQQFTADATLTSFGHAHNIAINETSGYAYVIGADPYNGGPIFIDISSPTTPVVMGGYGGSSYTHDAHIVTYTGPDPDYQGREILFGSNSDGGENNQVVIVDVTDKSNPRLISNATYSNGGYTHQNWIDEAHRFLYVGDELDERRYGNRTKTLVFDLEDLDNPSLHYSYLGVTSAIDHNGYTKGNSLFLANYSAGFREIDIENIGTESMTEIGFFDSFPENNNNSFSGVWNVYPFFESGLIAISDSSRGLFLVQRSN
ncbi:MAG: choice-of-anchor B family protein [Flavobacteriaceae bacterium]|nr:choice-of-anchor B family protein [Flavobacteriaceae bacterium]